MKKTNAIFLSIAASFLMSACTSSDHMTFWGTPIDGPKQEFVRKMLKKTDAVVQDNIGNQTLIGPFEHDNQNSYFLVVESKPDVDVVNKVALLYPSMRNWKEYEDKYNEMKRELTQKYGEPVGSVEQFQDPDVKPQDKLSKFFLKEAQYSTLFYDDKGSVELSIKGYGHQSLFSVRITVTYIDGINNESYEDVGDECWGEE